MEDFRKGNKGQPEQYQNVLPRRPEQGNASVITKETTGPKNSKLKLNTGTSY